MSFLNKLFKKFSRKNNHKLSELDKFLTPISSRLKRKLKRKSKHTIGNPYNPSYHTSHPTYTHLDKYFEQKSFGKRKTKTKKKYKKVLKSRKYRK